MSSQRSHWKSPLLLFHGFSFPVESLRPNSQVQVCSLNCQTAPSIPHSLTQIPREWFCSQVRCSLSLCWAGGLTPPGSLICPWVSCPSPGTYFEQPCSNFLSRFGSVSRYQDRKKTTQFGILWIFTWIVYNYR